MAVWSIVPILVVAFALDGQRRRRLLERIGHLPMIARMTATLLAGAPSLARGAARSPAWRCWCWRWRGRRCRGAPSSPRAAASTSWSRSTSRKSMLARDIYPTRLDRAKAELARFIDTLKGDRVGPGRLRRRDHVLSAHRRLRGGQAVLARPRPDDMPVGGTDLGRALTASTELLDARARRARARSGRRR